MLATLPATSEEMRARGWDYIDIILVTGDAYVDHPAFGVALIGRWLEAHGYRVAVLAQPRHDSPADFTVFGPPRLFWGISSGNLDSIVANYSGNGKVRDQDSYSSGGNPYFGSERIKKERRRPDRATIRYTALARAAFKDVPVVLGGLEASLRRFVHYDYQQKRLRSSILTDAKADILIYGMGERAVLEIARRLDHEKALDRIDGTCVRITDSQIKDIKGHHFLPSWQEINQDQASFLDAELSIDRHARSGEQKVLVQQQKSMWVVQNPPAPPLLSDELDRLYSLPFSRKPHHLSGDIPAYRMIKDSITIVRGCCGNCSFCAIARHQGPVITSRSEDSVMAEIRQLTMMDDFTGVVSDLGGPTANLYGVGCRLAKCKRHDCLNGGICKHLTMDEDRYRSLLARALKVDGVRHAFVSSGLRMELFLQTPNLLEDILLKHTPGSMKIAPEHTEKEVLRLMHKQGPEVLEKFMVKCRDIGRRHRRKIHFTPYLISAHPGCRLADMKAMAAKLAGLDLEVRQFQDFTPTPGTIATAMYVAGLDRDSLASIYVARTDNERRQQRKVLEAFRPVAKGRKGSKKMVKNKRRRN